MGSPIYADLLFALNKARVRFLIAGGVAVNLHGVPRFTQDLDLVVDLAPKNASRFVDVMTRQGYKPRVPVDPQQLADPGMRRVWRREKNRLVFTFYHPTRPLEMVDVFVDLPQPYGGLHRDRTVIRQGGLRVPLLSIAHLIRFKTGTGRRQDAADIENLRVLQRTGKKER